MPRVVAAEEKTIHYCLLKTLTIIICEHHGAVESRNKKTKKTKKKKKKTWFLAPSCIALTLTSSLALADYASLVAFETGPGRGVPDIPDSSPCSLFFGTFLLSVGAPKDGSNRPRLRLREHGLCLNSHVFTFLACR